MSFLVDVAANIDSTFASAQTISSGVVTAARPLFVSAMAIWFVMIGYEVAFGKTEDTITYVFTKIGKVMIVGTFALYGWNELAYPFFRDLPTYINGLFTSQPNIAASLESYIFNPLVRLWQSIINGFLNAVSIGHILMHPIDSALDIIIYIIVSLCVAVLSCICIVLAIVAFVTYYMPYSMMHLLLIVGPFFLMLMPFPVTQRYFESWVNGVVTASLAMALSCIMVLLASNLVGLDTWATYTAFPKAGYTVSESNFYTIFIEIVSKSAQALLTMFMFTKLHDLAASLGGGMNFGGLQGIIRAINRPGGNRKPNDPPQGKPNTVEGGSGRQPTLRQSAQQSLANGARRVGSGFARVGNDSANVVSHAYNRATKSAIRRYNKG